MRECLYEREGYVIFKAHSGYVLFNTNKPFEDGHTHLERFESGKILIDHCISKRIPDSRRAYMYTSLIRITDDEQYKQSLKTLMGFMSNKNKRFKGKKKKKANPSVNKSRM